MEVRRLSPVLVLCATLWGLRAAPADEKATYTLPGPPAWRVGDLVTKMFSYSRESRRTRTKVDGTELAGDVLVQSAHATVVEEVLEVAKNGEATRTIVYLKDWRWQENGGRVDYSARGLAIETEGPPATRSWRFIDSREGRRATPKATEWLDMWWGPVKESDEVYRPGWNPKRPVAVGEPWDVDVRPMIAGQFRGRLAIEDGKASGAGRITEVGEGRAHVVFSLTFPQFAVSGDLAGRSVLWVRGGVLTTEWNEWAPLEARPFPSTVLRKSSLDGMFRDETPEGTIEVGITRKASNEVTIAAGGEFPEALRPPPRVRTLVLADVQPLTGGRALWASDDGTAILQVVTLPKEGEELREKRYQMTFTRDQWADLERKIAAGELTGIQLPERAGAPGESRTGIAVTPITGPPVKVRKWQKDPEPHFDALQKYLRALCKPTGPVIREGLYDPKWAPFGFDRPW